MGHHLGLLRLPLVLLVIASVSSAAGQEPLLHAPFDAGDDALLRGESLTPYATHEGPRVTGLKGQARILGGLNRLSYFVNDGFFPREGSCSMWVRSQDWTPEAPHFVFFATFTLTEVTKGYVRVLLYKAHNGTDLLMLAQNTSEENLSTRIVTPMTGWDVGQWHHLALTWDPEGFELFVDGEAVGTCSMIDLPADGRWEIAVGTPYQSWAYLGKERSAIDEFTVWPRKLSADEIAQEHQTTLAAAPPEAFEMPDTTGGMPPIEDNLALDSAGAFALASSFADYEARYTDNLVDGRDDTIWQPFDATLPQWLEVRWPWPVRASEVIVRQTEGGHVARMVVHAWADDAWLQVAEATGGEDRDVVASFAEVSTDRVRVTIAEGAAEGLAVSSLAVRGPEQIMPGALVVSDVAERIALVSAEVTPPQCAPGERVRVSVKLRPEAALAEDYALLIELGETSIEPRYSDWTVARAIIEPDTPTSQWLPGQEQTVACEVRLPEFAPDGSLPVRIWGRSPETGATLNVGDAGGQVAGLTVLRGGERVDGVAATALAFREGSATLQMGDRATVPEGWAFTLPSYDRFHDYSQVGIHLYHLKALPLKWDGTAEQLARICALLDERIRALLRVDAGAQVLVQLDLRPTSEWLEANPGERLVTAQGTLGPHSFSSRAYNEGVLTFVREIVRYLKSQDYYDHVAGYLPMGCGAPDSVMGGMEGNLFQTDRDKLTVGDHNPQAIAEFRGWLREKYAGSVEALRIAWRNPALTFETATPVVAELVREGVDGGVFRDPMGSAMTFDYAKWLSGVMGRYYSRVLRAIREEAGRPVLTGTYYGYNVAHMRGYNTPATMLQNNNFDLPAMLDNPDWDYFAAPTPYSNRQPGSSVYTSFTYDSMRLHGKLLMGEMDHRTFVAGMKRYGRLRSDRHSAASLRRDMAGLIIDGAGYWFADWSRGTGRDAMGYFMEESILGTIADMREVHEQAIETGGRSVSQVAVFTSGETLSYHDVYRAPPVYHNLVPYTLWDAMGKIGAPYDIYAIEDLGAPEVQDGYRLYVFLNAFYLSAEQRAQIDALKRDGNTLLFLYAPGYVSRETGLDPANIQAVTGIGVGMKTEPELMTYTVTGEHPIVADIEPEHVVDFVPYGYDLSVQLHPPEISPVFHVDDAQAQALARYPDGRVAMAARDFGDWRSVYCAVPRMDSAWLRGVARWAGVHLYCDEDIVLKANNHLLMVHNGYDADRTLTIMLPEARTVTDADSGQQMVAEGTSFDVMLPKATTVLYWLK